MQACSHSSKINTQINQQIHFLNKNVEHSFPPSYNHNPLLAFLLLSHSTTAANVVVYNEGNRLVAGSYYYAMPIATQNVGGLTMFSNGSVGCPNFILARSANDKEFGILIKFSPQSPIANQNVYVSSDVNIVFKFLNPQPVCRRFFSTVWAVSGETVVLDGEEGSDASLFKLEEYGDQLSGGYKILAKEKVVLYEEKENGAILLALDSGNPLLVVFVKA